MPRARARGELGLDPDRPCLLFAADPARPEKGYERAAAPARGAGAALPPPARGRGEGRPGAAGGAGGLHRLPRGAAQPARVPLATTAATAVLAPSEREGF